MMLPAYHDRLILHHAQLRSQCNIIDGVASGEKAATREREGKQSHQVVKISAQRLMPQEPSSQRRMPTMAEGSSMVLVDRDK